MKGIPCLTLLGCKGRWGQGLVGFTGLRTNTLHACKTRDPPQRTGVTIGLFIGEKLMFF